jgi:transposase
VARYGQAFRDRIVARLLPPESAAIDVVSGEVGVIPVRGFADSDVI